MSKVAVCFFGQPRSLDFCSGILKPVFERGGKNEVDYFIHSWNECSYGTGWGDIDEKFKVEELTEKLKLLYNPKNILVEDPHTQGEFEEEDYMYSVLSVYYSLCKSITMKRKYEKEHKFRYDFVIVSRLDLGVYPCGNLEEFWDQYDWDDPEFLFPYEIKTTGGPNPIYATDCPEHGTHTQIDLIYLCRSKCADLLAGIYRWAHATGPSWDFSPSYRDSSGFRALYNFRTMGPDIVLYKFLAKEGLFIGLQYIGNFFPVRTAVDEYDLDPTDYKTRKAVCKYYNGFKPHEGRAWDVQNLGKVLVENGIIEEKDIPKPKNHIV